MQVSSPEPYVVNPLQLFVTMYLRLQKWMHFKRNIAHDQPKSELTMGHILRPMTHVIHQSIDP